MAKPPIELFMKASLNRRNFLKRTAVFAAGVAAFGGSPLRVVAGANDRVRVAVLGCNGRGLDHIRAWLELPNVEIACICDVDTRAVAKGLEAVAKKQERRPQGERFNLKNKLVREVGSEQKDLFQYDAVHFGNFINGFRNGEPLHAEIGEGQKSTTLCHLANIAWRTGHTVNFDPRSRKIVGDHQAAALAKRKYRHGWEPQI
jgi:hypothetical protein